MSSDSAAATTAAQGEIADPAKIKADNAAAAEANGSNGDAKTNGDSATNGTSPSKAAAEEPPVAGPSKSPTKKEVDVVKQAMGYLTAGKRDLLIRDPASAVASLAQACQLLGDHYGETAPECGEPYYYYGRALLDLARMEAGVIDNVLDGVPDEDDSADDSMVGDPEKCTDEEKEKVGKDVDEALKENYESCEKAKAEKEAKEAAAATNGDKKEEANGEGQSQTDGNCVAKPSEANGKASPKDKATNGKDSPKDKATNGKDSPKDKAANGKDSPKEKTSPAAKEGKVSPKDKASPKEKETNGKASPKESKTSPAAKDVKTSPKDKASPAAKDSSKASPGAKESKSSPASKEPKSSPSGAAKESKSSPATKDAKKSEDAEMTSPEVKKGGPTGEVNVSEDMELEVVSKNGVNGHATDKPKKESEEDSKDGDDEEEEGGEESQEDDKEEGGEDKENEETEEDEKDDSIQGDEAEKGDVAATEKEDEDEPSNLQLAWEMLELAKNILVKQSESLEKAEAKEADKERKDKVNSRICDTFQTLGELSIENENYPQAIEDLGTCLQRRKEMLPEDSRLIAETHYQLGVAQGFNLDFDRAVDSLNEAIAVLAKRVDNLKAKTESVDPAKKADAFYTREAEIKEIESLIPEIKEKIADTNDMKAETQKKLAETRLSLGLAAGAETEVAASAGGASSSGLGKSADTSKVSTISTSLIKKRKKSGEENGAAGDAESEPTSAKKPNLEAAAAESTKDSAASKQ